MARSPRRLALAATLAVLAAGAAAAQPVPGATPAPGQGTALFPEAAVTYTVEQLRTGPLSADVLKAMGPLHTLQAVEDLLKAHQVNFAWGVTDVRSDSLPAQTAAQIAALPPGEVFVIPSGDTFIIGVIVARR